MPVRSKLCGIRSRDDLGVALEAGADAIGLICGVTHVSEDALSEDAAQELARHVPPYVSTVLVTHLEGADEILKLAAFVGADTIQLHGLVDVDTVAAVFENAGGRRITKAIHVTGPEALDDADRFIELCHALHLDSRTDDRLGGTGELHDWSISRQIVEAAHRKARRPVVLSGGLRPDNLSDAIAAVRPYAVDVNSGIEDQQGNKELELASAFVAIARSSQGDPRFSA
jgi:phosphoribosylanthranilate isomerase